MDATPDRACLICGGALHDPKRRNKTCSDVCARILRGNTRRRRTQKPCEVCGTVMSLPPSLRQKRWCGLRCATIGRATGSSEGSYEVDPKTGCWLWLGSISHEGYPTGINWLGHSALAHRTFYRRYRGEIPHGTQLDHLCRMRRCVNPDHLEPVSPTENARRSAATKLTAQQVFEIRSLLPLGRKPRSKPTPSDLVARFGVSRRTIASIAAGHTWSDVWPTKRLAKGA